MISWSKTLINFSFFSQIHQQNKWQKNKKKPRLLALISHLPKISPFVLENLFSLSLLCMLKARNPNLSTALDSFSRKVSFFWGDLMGPIKTIKKKKRSAEKKADRNVLLAAATAAAAAASDALHSDDSSQSLDWWDGFSRRISGMGYVKSRFLCVFLVVHWHRLLDLKHFSESHYHSRITDVALCYSSFMYRFAYKLCF